MKTVTLLKVETAEIRVIDGRDKIEMYSVHNPFPVDYANHEYAVLTRQKSFDIERICFYGEDRYVALSEEIEEILHMFASDRANKELASMRDKVARTEHFNVLLANKIDTYNNLPWWKRIFKKVE